MDPIVSAPEPARLNAVMVRFDPKARTAWHTHPFGQTLYVVAGKGLICKQGEATQVILPGDTVWIAPGEKHWHGASAECGMTHIAMQEQDEAGSAAVWMEKVTDAEYAQ